MELDLLEKRTLTSVIPISFLIFLFIPQSLKFKILFFGTTIYFLVLFFLCIGWAEETNPDRKFIIAFLVSIFHTFLFFFGAIFSLSLSSLILKFFPFEIIKIFKDRILKELKLLIPF